MTWIKIQLVVELRSNIFKEKFLYYVVDISLNLDHFIYN